MKSKLNQAFHGPNTNNLLYILQFIGTFLCKLTKNVYGFRSSTTSNHDQATVRTKMIGVMKLSVLNPQPANLC